MLSGTYSCLFLIKSLRCKRCLTSDEHCRLPEFKIDESPVRTVTFTGSRDSGGSGRGGDGGCGNDGDRAGKSGGDGKSGGGGKTVRGISGAGDGGRSGGSKKRARTQESLPAQGVAHAGAEDGDDEAAGEDAPFGLPVGLPLADRKQLWSGCAACKLRLCLRPALSTQPPLLSRCRCAPLSPGTCPVPAAINHKVACQ